MPVQANRNDAHRLSSDPYDVIAAVNAVRAANGLPPYKVNDALMAAAQAHSEYQANLGSLTHSGADGSTPKQRAVAAGYGGGKTVFVSENIAMGLNMSAQGAVNIWQGDNLHLDTMLSFSYQDAGVGVAVVEDVVYYTLDAGNISGNAAPPGQAPAESTQTPPATVQPAATLDASQIIQPILVSTPLPDGSVVHIVQSGQFLINIADLYGISLEELLKLNGLTEKSIIYPGDELLIRPAQASPTVTATEASPSPTPTPPVLETATLMPASPTIQDPVLGSQTPSLQPGAEDSTVDPLLIAVVILIVVGLAFVLVGSLMKRKV
jgi:LysM repeat protein